MGEYILLKSPHKKWILKIDDIKVIGLLNSIYEGTLTDTIEVIDRFEYIHMYMKGNLLDFKGMDNDMLITLLKYADFLDYKEMMDFLGTQLAERLEDLRLEELTAFQHKFATIK